MESEVEEMGLQDMPCHGFLLSETEGGKRSSTLHYNLNELAPLGSCV